LKDDQEGVLPTRPLSRFIGIRSSKQRPASSLIEVFGENRRTEFEISLSDPLGKDTFLANG